MILLDHIRSLARFNEAMNNKVYRTARRLPQSVLEAEKGAFFGSIFGTLNHLVVTDICWLKRFRAHPGNSEALMPLDETTYPEWYDTRMAPTLDSLYDRRQSLDEMIIKWADHLQEDDMEFPLRYQNMQQKAFCKPFGHLVLHLFNHQIHHRGQVTTLLSQENLHVDGTGVLPFVPDSQI